MQECVLLDWAAGQVAGRSSGIAVAVTVGVAIAILSRGCGRGDVRDLLGVGVFAADLGDAYVASFAGLGEGVVAAVEVLALLQGVISRNWGVILWVGSSYLELVLEEVLLVGELAVQAEELGLLLRHFLLRCVSERPLQKGCADSSYMSSDG